MKKFLLTTVAAFIVAMGANAQFARVAQNATKMDIPAGVKMVKVETLKNNTSIVAKNTTARRAASIAGTYVMDATNWYQDFTSCTSFTIEEATGTTKVCEFSEEGDLSFNRDFEYNVKLTDFSYAGGVAYGKYYPEDGVLHIPTQVVGSKDSYGRIVMSGSQRSETGGVNYGADIMLVVNEDGGFDFDEEYAAGWFSFLPDYEESPGATWNYGFECEVYAVNGEMSADVSGHLRTDGQTSGWQDERATYPVAVEDLQSELVIHNFLGMAPISVNVNEDGTIAIPLPQFVDDYDYSEDGGFEYGCMRLVALDLEGTTIKRNYTKESLPGSVTTTNAGKVYDFFELTSEGNVLQDADHVPYLSVATAADAEGAAYGMGNLFAIRIIVANVGTGINEAKANAQSTSKTYNLMGQQVNGDAKGLIIRDGKKFLNK